MSTLNSSNSGVYIPSVRDLMMQLWGRVRREESLPDSHNKCQNRSFLTMFSNIFTVGAPVVDGAFAGGFDGGRKDGLAIARASNFATSSGKAGFGFPASIS